jgi:acyl-CoA hydrolase
VERERKMQSPFWNVNRPAVIPADITIAKTIAETASVTSRLMEVLDSNNHGNVHGGVIMRMVDESSAVVAIKHCRRPVVTKRVDQLTFLAPAYIGDVVHIHCQMNYVGRTSMEVGVEVLAESLGTGEVRRICSSQVVFVALDENRRPTPVPPLKATTPEENTRIQKAKARRERTLQLEQELDAEF